MAILFLEANVDKLVAELKRGQEASKGLALDTAKTAKQLDDLSRTATTASAPIASVATAQRTVTAATTAATTATAASTVATIASANAARASAFATGILTRAWSGFTRVLLVTPIVAIATAVATLAASALQSAFGMGKAADEADAYTDSLHRVADAERTLRVLQGRGTEVAADAAVRAAQDRLEALRQQYDEAVKLQDDVSESLSSARRISSAARGPIVLSASAASLESDRIRRGPTPDLAAIEKDIAAAEKGLEDARARAGENTQGERALNDQLKARMAIIKDLARGYALLSGQTVAGLSAQQRLLDAGVPFGAATTAGRLVSRFDRAVSGDVGGSRADVRRSDYDPVAEVAAAASSLSAAIEASEQAVRAAQPGYQASVENIRALAEAAALPPPLITRLVAEEEARIATVSALANAERMAAKAQAEFQASAAGYSGAFQGAAIDFLTGVETATGALQNFAARVASILIEQATQDTANAVGTGIASYFSSSSSTTASAMGNVFSPRGVVPFANGGVVSQPSLFSYGGGQIGSIAERGPEAIVPLDRTRSGRLGIAGGGGTTIVNVYGATDANSFRRSEKQIASRAQSAVRPR